MPVGQAAATGPLFMRGGVQYTDGRSMSGFVVDARRRHLGHWDADLLEGTWRVDPEKAV